MPYITVNNHQLSFASVFAIVLGLSASACVNGILEPLDTETGQDETAIQETEDPAKVQAPALYPGENPVEFATEADAANDDKTAQDNSPPSPHDIDSDGDGVPDPFDNCINVANGPLAATGSCNNQEDFDGDGYGNACDADLNNDGAAGNDDVAIALGAQGVGNHEADINCDGGVGLDDVALILTANNTPPGPSGYHEYIDYGFIFVDGTVLSVADDLLRLEECEIERTSAPTTDGVAPITITDHVISADGCAVEGLNFVRHLGYSWKRFSDISGKAANLTRCQRWISHGVVENWPELAAGEELWDYYMANYAGAAPSGMEWSNSTRYCGAGFSTDKQFGFVVKYTDISMNKAGLAVMRTWSSSASDDIGWDRWSTGPSATTPDGYVVNPGAGHSVGYYIRPRPVY